MKRYIDNFLIIISFLGSIFTIIDAQSIPKVERVKLFTSNLIIKDSLFLQRIDSLIFNSICPEIKNQNSKLKIFNVYCKKNNTQENNFTLNFNLDSRIQIYNESDLKGCFDYKGYLFLWFNDIPPKLFSLSNQKRKLTYIKGVPHIAVEVATFEFNYTEENLTLTGICCY